MEQYTTIKFAIDDPCYRWLSLRPRQQRFPQAANGQTVEDTRARRVPHQQCDGIAVDAGQISPSPSEPRTQMVRQCLPGQHMIGDGNLWCRCETAEFAEIHSLHVASLARLLECHDMMVKAEGIRTIENAKAAARQPIAQFRVLVRGRTRPASLLAERSTTTRFGAGCSQWARCRSSLLQ